MNKCLTEVSGVREEGVREEGEREGGRVILATAHHGRESKAADHITSTMDSGSEA